MAQGPAPATPSFFGLFTALVIAVYVSTVILAALQLFFLPFVFLGTGGAIVGGALAAAIVFSIQRSIVGSSRAGTLPRYSCSPPPFPGC